jgi:hypothetical protein
MKIISIIFLVAFLSGCDSGNAASKTQGLDPATATDAQIYREFEVCMNRSKKIIGDDKMKGRQIAAKCMIDLQKYGDERAKKAFAYYFDLKMK